MGLHAEIAVRRGARTIRAELNADDGQTLALLGPNGAGKTSVVEAIAGLVETEPGTRIEIDGERIDGLPPDHRPIGVAFQDDLLFPHLSARENVAFPLRARGAPAGEARGRAADLLERLAPAVRPAAKPRSLSGGERRRVSLARALAAEPRLLLLDEPLAGVDVSARAELRALLREITASFLGVTVLVAHEPIDALTLADRVSILEDGRITQTGTPEEIRRMPRTRYAAELVGVNLFVGMLEPLPDGASRLRTAEGDLVVASPVGRGPAASELGSGASPDPRDLADPRVLATLRPADVALHVGPPEGSARNVLRGTITEIAIEGDRARVRLASSPPVVAEVTAGSIDRLGLREGAEAYASFKAVEVLLHPGSGAGPTPQADPVPGTL